MKRMLNDISGKIDKKFLILPVGLALVIVGVSLILLWFDDLAIVFRGTIGFVIALAGLLTLYSLNK